MKRKSTKAKTANSSPSKRKKSSRQTPSSSTRSKTLPRELVARLGLSSDHLLSSEYDIPLNRISAERKRRKIQQAHLEWNETQLALLGTESDAKVATRLGVTKSAVYMRRIQQGIPSCHVASKRSAHKWTKRELKMLGKVSDGVIARKIGIDATQVNEKRHILGIASSQKSSVPRRKWTKKEIALLGQMADRVVGEKIGVHRHSVAEKRRELDIPAFANKGLKDDKQVWTAKAKRLLGKIPDPALAEMLGVSTYRVRHRRSKEGIPSCNPRRKWKAEEDALLATMTDQAVAEMTDRTVDSVSARRMRLNIPVHESGKTS